MKKNKQIALVLGTRPEIIKLSPLIRLFQKKKVPHFVIHSGQHYSYAMDKLFFEDLDLPTPRYRLDVRSKGALSQSEQTGRLLIEIEKVLIKEMPYCVLVQGDTNTVLAGAMTVSKFSTTKEFTGVQMLLGHVEAGLRSYDRSMPEEINRFISDHISDLLFAPTKNGAAILAKEGVAREKIFMTGNTIVDAVQANVKIARRSSKILDTLGVKRGNYFLLTLHRQENVDNKQRLKSVLEGLNLIGKTFGHEIIFPIHPRTVHKIRQFGYELPKGIRAIEPVGFLDFLLLESEARLLLTDSGGVQEESMILRVPCVTLRDNTERPETVTCGANRLAGAQPKVMLAAARHMLKSKRRWKNVLGDGRAAERILKIVERHRP